MCMVSVKRLSQELIPSLANGHQFNIGFVFDCEEELKNGEEKFVREIIETLFLLHFCVFVVQKSILTRFTVDKTFLGANNIGVMSAKRSLFLDCLSVGLRLSTYPPCLA